MNASTTIAMLPSKGMLSFYSYYSCFTLSLSWFIAPLLFYTIITKSTNLSNLKYLIFNHSLWCLTFQTSIAVFKPVILSPALAAYPLGLLRNGSYLTTSIICIFVINVVVICIASLLATLLCRYMLVFPTGITRHLNKKIFILITTFFALIMCSLIGFVGINIFWTNESDMHLWAMEYSPTFAQYLSRESVASIFIPLSCIEIPFLIAIINDIIILSILIIVFTYFIYLVKTLQLQSANANLKRSLILSGAVETFLVLILLLCPCLFLMIFIRFEVINSADSVCVLLCASLTHCSLEFISTLFLVSPYRKFVNSLLSKVFPCRIQKSKRVNIKIITMQSTLTSNF